MRGQTVGPSRPDPEPTFDQAQSWWSKMQRPATHLGVPGHPQQATVLWNTGLLFCSIPYEYRDGRPRLGQLFGHAFALSWDRMGDELDALQLEFSFGAEYHVPDRMDNTSGEVQQELLEGRLPVVISRLKHDGLEWTCTAFAHDAGDPDLAVEEQDLLTEVQWTAHNPSRRARPAQLSCHLTCPHAVIGYKVAMEERAQPYLRALRWDSPLMLDDRRGARLAAAAGAGEVAFLRRLPDEAAASALGLGQDVLQFRARLPAGGSATFRLVVPYFATDPQALRQALRTRFEVALGRVQKQWGRALDATRLETPERVVNDTADACLYHAMMATGRRPSTANTILKCAPNNYEGVWSAHSAIAAFSMDLRGQHALSREVFETFLANQGPLPDHVLKLFGDSQVAASEGFSPHPGFLGNIEGYMAIIWSFYHGWIMWALGQHARLTNDWKWLKQHANQLSLACEWIEAQRKRTRLREAKGEKVLSYGLLPASNAFDWGFGHMFWSDAHTYRGLAEIAACLKRLRHPRAAAFLAQAEDYRQDIIAAVARSRDASPRVPLDDGRTIPFVPMSVEMRDYFLPDWTYISCGPLNLVWAGVIPPHHELTEQVLAFLHAGRPLGEWQERQEGFVGRQWYPKYQGWDWGARTPADEDFLEATRPAEGRCYLWRHKMTYEPGWIPQAFTFLRRDDVPALLEHFYSLISNGGQHVDLRTPIEQRDGVPWTQPGDANLLWLMRDMLVREEGETLVLAGSCPRRWLADGQTVGVTKLPTHFGPVTYRLEAKKSKVTGAFRFDLHSRPKAIRLRLRRPDGALPKRVLVNGKPAATEGEWLSLPPTARRLEARY